MDRLAWTPLPPVFHFGEFQLLSQEGVRVYEGIDKVGQQRPLRPAKAIKASKDD